MKSKKYSSNQHMILVSDSDWKTIKNRARAQDMSVSSFLLSAVRADNNPIATDGGINNAESRRLYEAVMEMASRHRRLERPIAKVTRETSMDGMGGTVDLRGAVRALYLMEADKRRRRAKR